MINQHWRWITSINVCLAALASLALKNDGVVRGVWDYSLVCADPAAAVTLN